MTAHNVYDIAGGLAMFTLLVLFLIARFGSPEDDE